MKFTSAAALSLLASTSYAFTPSKGYSNLQRLFAATMEETAPSREAPGAGWEPEWEDRPGKNPEEFLKSDMSKPDLAGMWECPLTRWDSEG